MHKNISADEKKTEELIQSLSAIPARDASRSSQGKERFLAQARMMKPAVSRQADDRHTGWNANLIERMIDQMKLNPKLSTILATLAVIVVVTVLVARTYSPVSAQQIVERADAARTTNAAATGIRHTVIDLFDTTTEFSGDLAGIHRVVEDFYDPASGFYRSVVKDTSGALLRGGSVDGKFDYSFDHPSADAVSIQRTPLSADQQSKANAVSVDAGADDLFEQFKNNPNVKLASTITWTDGSKAYVLELKSYQADPAGQKTYTGSTSMTFNAKTYALLESVSTRVKDGKDEVISDAKFLTDEVLPAGTAVAWDLSDLPGVSYVDASAPEQEDVTFGTLTVDELAAHAQAYILNPVPTGYTQEIDAVTNQPADQEFQYEVNYKQNGKTVFGLQSVGQLGVDFIQQSFSDGSYIAANGLQIFYSTSHPSNGNGVSAALVTPDAGDYLLSSTLTREDVQKLVETLVKIK
jgi:hypothetical protein